MRALSDTGPLCAEIVFVRGKMVKAEGLQVLEKRMEALEVTNS